MTVATQFLISNRITRKGRDVSLLLMIVEGMHGEEDLTRYRLIVTLVTVTNVYTPATHFPVNA